MPQANLLVLKDSSSALVPTLLTTANSVNTLAMRSFVFTEKNVNEISVKIERTIRVAYYNQTNTVVTENTDVAVTHLKLKDSDERVLKAASVVAGMALLAGVISAYEGYRVAISLKDINSALTQAGLGCAAAFPLLLFGVDALPMVIITCTGSLAGALVGIGRVLLDRSVPVIVLKTERAEIRTMLGGLLRGFGGGTTLEALITNALDPVTASALYRKAYEESFGSIGLDELRSIKNKIEEIRGYFIVDMGDGKGKIVTMKEVMKYINDLKNNVSDLSGRIAEIEKVSYGGIGLSMVNLLGLLGLKSELDRVRTDLKQSAKKLESRISSVEEMNYGNLAFNLFNMLSVLGMNEELNELDKRVRGVEETVKKLENQYGRNFADIQRELVKLNEKISNIDNVAFGSLGIALVSYGGLMTLLNELSKVRNKLSDIESTLKSMSQERIATSTELGKLQSKLKDLEEAIDECCVPTSYDEAVEETNRLRRSLKPFKSLKGLPRLAYKLLHGSLLPMPLSIPGEFTSALSLIGLGYGAIVNAMAYLLV